jgi:hypothetical protein
MRVSSSHPSQPGDASLPSVTDVPEVRWIPSHTSAHLPPLALTSSKSDATERAERVNAAIVVVLTLACTALSIFDLFLLA